MLKRKILNIDKTTDHIFSQYLNKVKVLSNIYQYFLIEKITPWTSCFEIEKQITLLITLKITSKHVLNRKQNDYFLEELTRL